MAKAKVNKSAEIREALKATPEKTAAEIAKAIGVTPTLVYNVKANMDRKAGIVRPKIHRKKSKRSRAAPAAMAGKAPSHSAANSTSELDSALTFVEKVGGLNHAEHLIGKLRTIKKVL